MPHGECRWIEAENFNEEKIKIIPEQGTAGIMIEMDLEYSESLHEDYND